MHRCPLCGQVYSDELMYCLQDGTSLVDDQRDQEIPTVVRPKRIILTRRRPLFRYLLFGILGLLGVLFASALGAFLVWHWLAGSNDNEDIRNDQPSASPTPKSTPPGITPTPVKASPLPTQNAEIERPTPSRPVTPEAADDAEFRDPGTSRINFRRGRVSERVTGRVAKSRSFVLRTISGQNLTASISSADDCVVFSNGASSTAFSTSAGDNRLDLRNNCGRPARFTLSVTVR
ncbi:MAG: hypothetical protein PSX80_05370 [bacterium]|nr:hypothetical protein [bacterium]